MIVSGNGAVVGIRLFYPLIYVALPRAHSSADKVIYIS